MKASHPGGTEDGKAGRSTIEVPRKPTMAMLAAASSAAGVSIETAWTIWRVMIAAADER